MICVTEEDESERIIGSLVLDSDGTGGFGACANWAADLLQDPQTAAGR